MTPEEMLLKAVKERHYNGVRRGFEKAKVNAPDEVGWTSLHYAAYHGFKTQNSEPKRAPVRMQTLIASRNSARACLGRACSCSGVMYVILAVERGAR
jgi:hypothetical protein